MQASLKPGHTIQIQDIFNRADSLCVCPFCWGASWQLYGPDDYVTLVQSVTGWNVTLEELLTVGARRVNVMRAFNYREGFSRDRDKLAEKFLRHRSKVDPPMANV